MAIAARWHLVIGNRAEGVSRRFGSYRDVVAVAGFEFAVFGDEPPIPRGA